MLKTKSIQDTVEKKDGIRVCIMRRPDSWAKFDIWFPVLAPSNKLLTEYHKKKLNWQDFEKKFKQDVIKKQKKYLGLLVEIALKRKITILCWEKTPEYCHRRLVVEECKKMNKKLKIILK